MLGFNSTTINIFLRHLEKLLWRKTVFITDTLIVLKAR